MRKFQINSLFLSAPYPGTLKFKGQPTGLLYALSVLANRKSLELGEKKLKQHMVVWGPDTVLDFDKSNFKKELSNYLKTKKPQFVGISTFTISYKNSINIFKFIKKILPKTIVIFGGSHEDNFVKYYRKKNKIDVDFVVSGDGMFILDWLYSLIENNWPISLDELKNKILKQKDELGKLPGTGLLLFNHKNKLINLFTQTNILDSIYRKPIRLDQIPIMPRYLLKDEKEVSSCFDIFNNKKTAQMMIGQGCPFSCGFCSEGIKKVWYDLDSPRSLNFIRSLNHVKKELKILKKEKYKAIFFDDSTFLAKPKNYVFDLIKLVGKYGFIWGCQTTQSSIHTFADLMTFFKENGCEYIYIGLEHFDKEMRDSFGKQIGSGNKFLNYNFEDTLTIIKKARINLAVSLTFGHPDPLSNNEKTRENKNTVKFAIDKTSDLIKKFPNIIGVSLNIITYHPGTKITQRYEEKMGDIGFTDLPNNEKPFTIFEEGMGPHAPGMSKQLANYILRYAKKKFGDKLWI